MSADRNPEGARARDDGSVERPYGCQSICRGCRFGKMQTHVKHNFRDPLGRDQRPDEALHASHFPDRARIYVMESHCFSEDFVVIKDNGDRLHSVFSDVAACDFFEAKEK